MIDKVADRQVKQLFQKLSQIEVKHQDRILSEYAKIAGAAVSRDEFEKTQVMPAMEGGLTTEEYLQRYRVDLKRPAEVISLAMAIEAQALDLYHRAAERSETEATGSALMQIANEERSHLQQLGKLFETL